MGHPITTFKKHYSEKYKTAIGKIALDAEVACPNRKRGGCTFCAAASYTPFYLQKGDPIPTQLDKGKKYLATHGFQKYFAYFQQETTTAAATSHLIPKFTHPLQDRDCVGLIISTRPDYVGDDLLEELVVLQHEFQKEVVIELGLQSAHDHTLFELNRNHTVADFTDAVMRIKKCRCIEIGAHLILGLPGESKQDIIATAQMIASLDVDHVKLHHLQVIKDTPLHSLYIKNPFMVYGPRQYLALLAEILGYLQRRMVIHRLWSSTSSDLLVEPKWDTPYHELQQILLDIMKEKSIRQGCYHMKTLTC